MEELEGFERNPKGIPPSMVLLKRQYYAGKDELKIETSFPEWTTRVSAQYGTAVTGSTMLR